MKIKFIALIAALVLAFVASSPTSASAQARWAYPAAQVQSFSPPPEWGDPSRWDGPETFGRWCPAGSGIVPDEWDPYADRCAPARGNYAF